MKFLLKIFKKEEMRSSIKSVLYRFPVAIIVSGCVTVLFFLLIAGNLDNTLSETIGKYILTFIITFFLSVSTTILCESLDGKYAKGLLPHVGVLVFGALFYYFFPSDLESFNTIIFFILTLFGIIASLFIAPYIKHIQKGKYLEQSYYVYFYKISVVFFLSAIVGGALVALGNIAILTVTTLFDIGYMAGGDIHGYWTSFALCFVTPCFALTQIPTKGSFEEQYFNENAFFHFLIRYIALPFIYIYLIILYAYTLKVLLNFSDWPKGEVSWMVIGFSIFGYIIYIFSYIFEQGKKLGSHKLIHIYRKYFPIAILPQIGMLFYAIFLRIGQYDFTINRYFVVVFGFCLLVTSLYLIISQKKSLLFIPTLLTLFTLAISIGPWSVYNFPLERQKARLIENLTTANILQNGEIVPLENYNEIDSALSGEIYSGIQYICSYNSCESIKEIFAEQYQDLLTKSKEDFNNSTGNYSYKQNLDYEPTYQEPSKWEIQNYITDTIKVQNYTGTGTNLGETYYMYSNDSYFPIKVSGYDYVLQTDMYNNQDDIQKVSIDNKTQTMSIQIGDVQESVLLGSIIDTLRTRYLLDMNPILQKEENIFPFDTDSFEGNFIVQSASMFADPDHIQTQPYNREYVQGIILLRTK